MTNFIKENFINDGMYLHYMVGTERKFVWRTKRSSGKTELNGVISFLIKNFTVEEWFEKANEGIAPLYIAQEKGYILPHIKKWMKEGGYEISKEGYDKYMNDRVSWAVRK